MAALSGTLSTSLLGSLENSAVYRHLMGASTAVSTAVPSTPVVDYVVSKIVPYLPDHAAAYVSDPTNYPEMLEQFLVSFLLLIVSFIALGLPFNLRLLFYPEGRSDKEENREVMFHKQFELLWPDISACEHARLVLPPTCRRIPNYQPPASTRESVKSGLPGASSHGSDGGGGVDDSALGRIGRAVSVVGDVVEERVRNWGSRKKKSTRDVREDKIREGEEEGKEANSERSENSEKTTPTKEEPQAPTIRTERSVHAKSSNRKDSASSAATNEVFESPKPSPALGPLSTPKTSPQSLTAEEMGEIENTASMLKVPSSSESNNINGRVLHKGSGSEKMAFFDAASSNSAIRKMSQPTVLPDDNGYVFDGIGEDRTPLVVFVNSKSGGNQGRLLISQLRRVLNPIQVHDLASGPPDRVLKSFSALPKSRILVCGGDGTVAWIMDALEKLDMKESRKPPIAILPLGTGNDLARIHGWGGGYNNESLLDVLKEVGRGYVSLCDRWRVEVERKGKKKIKVFNNYFGIGADAQAALDFHSLRETKPELFFSRMTNKVWYAFLGAEDIFKASCDDIPQKINLKADGLEVEIPDDCQGLIFLNIDSYAGGIKLWATGQFPGEYDEDGMDDDDDDDVKTGKRRKRFGSMDSSQMPRTKEELDKSRTHDSSCQDGMLDIVAIRGCLHLGQINVGLSRAQKLCQCKELEITTERKYPCQLDGEPWGQSACTIKVTRKEEHAIMLHRAEPRTGGDVATEMIELLDWAEDKKIIDKKQHQKITKEFSRRIEARNRSIQGYGSRENLLSYGAKAVRNMPFFDTPTNKKKKRDKEQELQFLDYELGEEHRGF
eukprot:CAMPEP_0118672428 /NCGR_PEP_ID=MMETSP0785-20121206/22534_1 /TAXON_ID=91992 /ORGANISM="Bolidomonas pacifica, Strain CCMP 1866" /LENGTH=836 /DNA_ID=CAMNT_0006567387 /DNA_START=209 /DNA_END=2717 /DNA_ORIENTATION=-